MLELGRAKGRYCYWKSALGLIIRIGKLFERVFVCCLILFPISFKNRRFSSAEFLDYIEGSDEVKTVKGGTSAAVLTRHDTSYRADD